MRAAVRIIRAKFDSAQTTPDNRRHWANADGLSADAAASPTSAGPSATVPATRWPTTPTPAGIVLTLANDVIGTGPAAPDAPGRRQDDDGVNQIIEREFAAWAKAIDLPGKLRTMRMARAQDGEAFGCCSPTTTWTRRSSWTSG